MFHNVLNTPLDNYSLPRQHLSVQSHWKHQKNVRNLLKTNIKDNRTTSGRRSCVFIVNCEQISHIYLVFLMLNLKK